MREVITSDEDLDSRACRMAAFEWLTQQVVLFDEVLPRSLLEQGFEFRGTTVKVVGPQGIFKPVQVKYYPLSITTTTSGPYKDSFDSSGNLLMYRYRGIDPDFHENRRLRDAMRDQIPLIYFHSTVRSRYLAIWPVFVVGDDRRNLTFTVAADDELSLRYDRDDEEPTIRRAYVTREVRHRIHQRTFRDRVLRAYRERCSICNLRHTPLLDAAHIIGDSEEAGAPLVSNGLSLCKLHHAAFDRSMFAIRPDYRIAVRQDILDEADGPMLLHGLQKIHGSEISVPARPQDRPDRDRLDQRYQEFRRMADLIIE